MNLEKRTTIYFEPEIHRALRMRAAADDISVSELVNNAIRQLLVEDLEDWAAIEERANEPSLDFEDFVRSLQQRGKL